MEFRVRFGRTFGVVGLMLAVTSVQALDVDTVNSGMGEESLAPAPRISAGPVLASPTVTPSASVPAAPAQADVFTVKGVVVTLSGTTGFDRDSALEQGARQSLPSVLASLGMTPEDAQKKVKSLGSAMRFVKGYKVVTESLIPVYSLTADITFNEGMVRKNFGGALPAKVSDEAVASPVVDEAAVVAEDIRPIKQFVVRITDSNPATVDKVRANLNRQASTKAVYRLLTSEGAELLVDTPLNAMQLRNSAGMDVQVTDLSDVAPQAPVTQAPASPVAVPSAETWQSEDD